MQILSLAFKNQHKLRVDFLIHACCSQVLSIQNSSISRKKYSFTIQLNIFIQTISSEYHTGIKTSNSLESSVKQI